VLIAEEVLWGGDLDLDEYTEPELCFFVKALGGNFLQ
jgi:hypothetical protein